MFGIVVFDFRILIQVDFVKFKGLGGIMVWVLDFDDFIGKGCGKGLYLLFYVINDEFNLNIF